ncbi:hypothetical protein NL676_008767 [Syzygium grande]|nr:hypothetical protein NL676_008767 [Syzygium grande]
MCLPTSCCPGLLDPNPYTFPFFLAADACHHGFSYSACDISIMTTFVPHALAAATTPDTAVDASISSNFSSRTHFKSY